MYELGNDKSVINGRDKIRNYLIYQLKVFEFYVQGSEELFKM